jgi:hypothetical protein
MRFFLFCIFFAVGLSAMGVSIICNDLISYYSYKGLLTASQANIDKLKSLNDDYDALLEQLHQDPNLFRRIARVTFGTEPENNETISPKARPEELSAARASLSKKIAQQSAESRLPNWLLRIKQPHRRVALFLAGAVLIIISFIFFGPVSKPSMQN